MKCGVGWFCKTPDCLWFYHVFAKFQSLTMMIWFRLDPCIVLSLDFANQCAWTWRLPLEIFQLGRLHTAPCWSIVHMTQTLPLLPASKTHQQSDSKCKVETNHGSGCGSAGREGHLVRRATVLSWAPTIHVLKYPWAIYKPKFVWVGVNGWLTSRWHLVG